MAIRRTSRIRAARPVAPRTPLDGPVDHSGMMILLAVFVLCASLAFIAWAVRLDAEQRNIEDQLSAMNRRIGPSLTIERSPQLTKN